MLQLMVKHLVELKATLVTCTFVRQICASIGFHVFYSINSTCFMKNDLTKNVTINKNVCLAG